MKTLKALAATLKADYGVVSLITTTNPKIEKNAKTSGIAGACLHLLPSFAPWVCSFAGLCRKLCLVKSGDPQAKYSKEKARYFRTYLYSANKQLFLFALIIHIAKWQQKVIKDGFKKQSFRLNATSDLLFERLFLTITDEHMPLLERYGIQCQIGKSYSVFQLFPTIIFYDYSKIPARFERELPENYSLTFSLDGSTNVDSAIKILNAGGTVAIPFYAVPETFTLIHSSGKAFNYPVFNGDNSDYRPDDPAKHIIGLVYKKVSNGESNENNGFIIDGESIKQAKKSDVLIARSA